MAIVSRAELELSIWEKNAEIAAKNAAEELEYLKDLVKDFSVIELGRSEDRAIAPVASDGGECRLIAEPFGFDLIRVADSEGTIYAEHVVSLADEPYTVAKKVYEESQLLQKFCERIDVKWNELSYLIPSQQTSDDSDLSTSEMLPVIRDILEWAALVELAAAARPFRVLLLKDGALRTQSLTRYTVPKLREYFKARYKADGTLIAGVSKKSILLNQLYLAFRTLRKLERESACFIKIPNDVLERIYKYQRYIKDQSFAKTTICKLAKGRSQYYVVDVADFMDEADMKKTLEILSAHSQTTFKRIGYPAQLLRAHEFASISKMDNSVVGRILKKRLIETVGKETADVLLAEMYLNQGFQSGGIR